MATPPLSVVVFDCETDCGFERLCGYSRDAFVRQVMQFTCVCALEMSAADVPAKRAEPPVHPGLRHLHDARRR